MYWDRIELNWQQFRGLVKEQWDLLSEEQLQRIHGKRDRLSAQIQEAYDITHDEAERQLSEWQRYQKLDKAA